MDGFLAINEAAVRRGTIASYGQNMRRANPPGLAWVRHSNWLRSAGVEQLKSEISPGRFFSPVTSENSDTTGRQIKGAYGAAEVLGVKPAALRCRISKLGLERGRRDW